MKYRSHIRHYKASFFIASITETYCLYRVYSCLNSKNSLYSVSGILCFLYVVINCSNNILESLANFSHCSKYLIPVHNFGLRTTCIS